MAARKKAEVQEAEQTKEQAAAKAQDAPAVDFKKIITEALTKTKREGIEGLLSYMDKAGFFTAPASGGNHSHAEGGLAEHSVNVMTVAEKMGVALFGGAEYNKIQDSVVIAALLHDLGKCGDYGKKMYVENILKSGKQSEAKPWKRNPELLPLDHATRSIKLATLFIDLTEEEEFAIRYHDGLYETANYGVKGHETKLYMLLHWADMWSSRVLEGDTGEGSEE